MAIKRPVRIFFGHFNSDENPYAQFSTLDDDTTYASFLTGILRNETDCMHNRIPPDERGQIDNFDEYIDLNHVSLEPSKANDLITFIDVAGVESDIAWKTQQQFDFLPTNKVTIEGPL